VVKPEICLLKYSTPYFYQFRRTVKPFTIRKAIVPGRSRQGAHAEADINSSGYNTAGGMQADGSYTDLGEQARA
jgi:hypothetical protein